MAQRVTHDGTSLNDVLTTGAESKPKFFNRAKHWGTATIENSSGTTSANTEKKTQSLSGLNIDYYLTSDLGGGQE